MLDKDIELSADNQKLVDILVKKTKEAVIKLDTYAELLAKTKIKIIKEMLNDAASSGQNRISIGWDKIFNYQNDSAICQDFENFEKSYYSLISNAKLKIAEILRNEGLGVDICLNFVTIFWLANGN